MIINSIVSLLYIVTRFIWVTSLAQYEGDRTNQDNREKQYIIISLQI